MACCSGLQPQRWLPRHILRFFCDNDLLTVSVLSPPSAAAAEECLGAVFEALRLRADTLVRAQSGHVKPPGSPIKPRLLKASAFVRVPAVWRAANCSRCACVCVCVCVSASQTGGVRAQSRFSSRSPPRHPNEVPLVHAPTLTSICSACTCPQVLEHSVQDESLQHGGDARGNFLGCHIA